MSLPDGGYDTKDAPDEGAVDRRSGSESSWSRMTSMVNQLTGDMKGIANRFDLSIKRLEWVVVAALAAASLFVIGMLISLLIEIWARGG